MTGLQRFEKCELPMWNFKFELKVEVKEKSLNFSASINLTASILSKTKVYMYIARSF